ncbi:TPA: peptidylprolyl isomerase, partial [Candidatus Woesearchaeota archaeon]|nr:peptidylprolyl isomerase [Candidatus Woesearchaeota archaeon]
MIAKGDFIELHYTGKLLDGSVFDTTDEAIAKESGIHSPRTKFGPTIICVGEKQLLPGLDAGLVGKKLGKHTIELQAQDAFGKRD